MISPNRQPDALRALAELLRRNPTAQRMLKALGWSPLSVPQLAHAVRRSGSTIRAYCRELRLAGVVEKTNRMVKLPGRGAARVWRAV